MKITDSDGKVQGPFTLKSMLGYYYYMYVDQSNDKIYFIYDPKRDKFRFTYQNNFSSWYSQSAHINGYNFTLIRPTDSE